MISPSSQPAVKPDRHLRARVIGRKCIVLLQEVILYQEPPGISSIGLRVVGYETPPKRVRKPKG